MEQEATKKKKKRGKTPASQGAPVSEPPLAGHSSVECDILDAVMDGERINTDGGSTSGNCVPLSDMSVNWLENAPVMEVNGNQGIQETALTEAVVTAPTAPTMEENLPVLLNLTNSTETAPPVGEVLPAIGLPAAPKDSQFFDDYHPLSEPKLVAMYENREFLLWKEYAPVLAGTRCLTSNNVLVNEKIERLSKLRDLIEADFTTLEQHKTMSLFQMDNVWSFEKRRVTESGECQDGNPVTAELDYIISHFDGAAHTALSKTMSSIKEVCYEAIVLNLHLAEVMKEFMTKYVDRICNPCLVNTTVDMPAVLLRDFEQAPLKDEVEELRTCIGMLSKFLRRRQDDRMFSKFVTNLLVKVVSVFLRVATWKDHMFLLHQVLGSPGRIPTWMMNFVQVPLPQEDFLVSPFTSRYLHHLVVVLSVLMSPIEHRRSSFGYLPDLADITARTANEREVDVSSWMVVDSEGEEDETGLSGEIDSHDIIELFNQLPLQQMYTSILKMEKNANNVYVINILKYNDRYMVELFAFCTVLIRLYEKGLHTYGRQLYQQFAKRLGQLIKHTVQYVTDAFDSYRVSIKSTPVLWRLQCEYDVFVMRAVNAIYSSKDLGMWQFLATIPFNLISRSTSWKIYYMLHSEYNSDVEKSMPRNVREWMVADMQVCVYQVLEDRLCALPESDAMYLLSAFSSLALPTHEHCEAYRQFIPSLTLTLFRIGFLSRLTQERFSKHICTLLAAITTNHPWLISTIMHNMASYNFIQSGRLCVDLFKDLPLNLWIPNPNDIATIRRWLCEKPLISIEFSLARLILSSLNCKPKVGGDADNDLFLGHYLHCNLALVVAEATLGFSETQGNTSTANTGVLNDMLTMMVGAGSGLDIATKWAWGMIFRLRIHSIHRGYGIPHKTIFTPEVYSHRIPDLFGSPELQMIANGVLARQPIACVVALLMTTWGHSVPLICTKGFPLIVDVLLRNQLHREAIACVNVLVPMFLNCPESLIGCDAFHSILVALCSADRGFIRMARNLLATDTSGPILRLTGAMIDTHLLDAQKERFGPKTLENMITMWLKCLAKVPDWINDSSVLYLMDIVLRKAFFFWNYHVSATFFLNQELVPSSRPSETSQTTQMNTPGQSNPLERNSTMNTPGQSNPLEQNSTLYNTSTTAATVPEFVNWVKHQLFPPFKSLMTRVSLPATPWFATFVLLAERDWQEDQQLWDAVRVELYNMQPGATNVNKAVKLAVAALQFPTTIPASNLAIYRWGQQALDTPIDHPLLPYIWHIFFMLYLGRVPSIPPNSAGSVGYKFYEGAVGQQTIKKMKKQVFDIAHHYCSIEGKLRAKENDETVDQDELRVQIREAVTTCKLFKTYHLWLEDARLMNNIILSNLEPMYDIPRLAAVLNGDDTPGREILIEYDVDQLQIKNETILAKALHRYETSKPRAPRMMNSPDLTRERLSKRLSSYVAPAEPMPMPVFRYITPDGPWNELHQIVIPNVNNQLKILTISGQVYSNDVAEHTALDCSIQESLPLMYSNVQCEKVLTAMCHSSPPHRGTNYRSRESTCAGQAEMRLLVTESQANEIFKKCFEESRRDWLTSIDMAVKPPRYETCAALIALEDGIGSVIEEKNNGNTLSSQRELATEELGVTLLFHLLSNYSQELAFFPPAREILHNCMTSLASVFLKDGCYAEQFLQALLEDMRLARVLSSNFHPVEASTFKFIRMYGMIASLAYKETDYTAFCMIVSQFDVSSWLHNHRTTLADRSALIEEIAKAISAAGLQPDEKKEKLNTIFRKDLMTMLLYQFPENFGNILNHLLRASALQRVSLDVWYDFINSFMQNNKVHLGMEMPKLRDEIRQFANEQSTLPYQELLQTSQLLSTYFLAERNTFGLYGLYPKYRTYVEPIMAFQALIGHLLTVAWLAHEEGQLSMIICCKLWQSLEMMYTPWIAPLWTEHLEEPVATWIDQLTDDRSVLLPWIPPDKQHASRAVMMFVEGVRFIFDSVSVDILSHLWEYYVAKFAHHCIPESVLVVVHAHLETLPWQQFRPTSLDMDLMYRVVTVSVPPEVHSFLGTIFVSVAWLPWLTYAMNVYKNDIEHQEKIHMYLLHLHVKMAKEKEVRKKSKITEMLSVAKKFQWHLVDATSYGQVIDFWVFRYDARVAAGLSEPYINPIDMCVMNLLEAAAGFTTEVQPLHPTTLYKRIFYVRGVLKMLIKCTEDRAIIDKHVNEVSGVIYALLSAIENITQRTVPEEHRLTECTLLVKEVVVILNRPDSSELKRLALKLCTTWLQRENCTSYVVRGFLGVLGTDVTNPNIMAQLLETCFTAYFKNTVVQESTPCWGAASQLMSPPILPNIEETLLTSGYLLTLHARLYKQMSETKSGQEELVILTNLVDWICQVKPSGLIESKLPLLWGVALLLIYRQCQFNENLVSVTRSIRRLISHFSDMCEEKGQFWTLLGSLGLRKNQVLSLKGRLLCRAMAAFLLAQLPDGPTEQMTLRVNATSPGAITECRDSVEGAATAVASGDAVRALRDLEALVGLKSHVELKDTIELAIKLIKDPTQTINTAKEVLGALTAELYTEQYLYILTAPDSD